MATTRSFPAWLRQQQGRGDAVADFAREVGGLTDFPESGGKAIYDGYFETTLEAQREVYERSWSEYTASPEPSVS